MRIFLLLSFLLPFFAFSQAVTDDFSDGDFTTNPSWAGSSADFIVNASFQLQLNNTVAGTSYLSTNFPATGSLSNTEWQFWIRMNFSPSANNLGRVYLASDNSDLTAPLNGYYLRFGENLSNDPIELYRQNGSTHTLLLRGTEGFIANAFAIRVKITRDAAGLWNLMADASGGYNFLSQGTVSDATFSNSGFFGVYCLYTSSNANRYFFDDFYTGPIIIDNTPPVVTGVSVNSSTELEVRFSEGVEAATAENITNYTANNGIGNPATAERLNNNPSIVKLTFASPFADGIMNSLNVKNVKDYSGNPMVASNHIFNFYTVKPFDVVFNEIMADPSPAVGLPEFEYIELYNKTSVPINIKNWSLAYSNSTRVLPDAAIPPDSFIVLCAPIAFPDLQQYGNVVAVTSMAQSALSNTGTTLSLTDNTGKLIHFITYDDTWYQDSKKKDGGWSLEQMDPRNPCSGKRNWKASIHPAGGTPGRRNSVFGNNPDNTPPKAVSTCVLSANMIEVFFDEPVSGAGLTSPANYTIDKGIGNPTSIAMGSVISGSVILFLGQDIQQGLAYTITINGNIKDCLGNTMGKQSIMFGIKEADYLDVVINEIMADPDPVVGLPNEEYFELYNRTDFPLNLKGWTVTIGNNVKTFPCISIMPKDYLIVCHSNSAEYFAPYGAVASIPSLGGISNAGGTITIRNDVGKIITSITYSDSWYGDNKKKEGGWSLEQIDYNNPCGGRENWTASKGTLGGTPGAKNSVIAANPDKKSPELERVSIIDEFSIRLIFNEPLHPNTALKAEAFEIDNGIGKPNFTVPVAPQNQEVILSLPIALKKHIIYTVRVKNLIKDCVGNVVSTSENSARFAIPDSMEANDIVINEILFNPREGGSDFVELFNRTEKILDLKDIRLSSIDAGTGELTSIKEIDVNGYLLFPGEYVVLTANAAAVREHYNVNTKNFKQMESLPAFANTQGRAAISLIDGTTIDRMEYTDKMHFPLLRNLKGVSLERVDTERPSSDQTNWMSAAENAGFATPGYRNSQFTRVEPADSPISIDPKVFSPDNDGYNDVVNISYKLDEPGYIGTIAIYDRAGRMVRQLMRSELLGMEGTISWDGITETREKASVGIYIVLVEFFDLKGNVKHYKQTCVLATRF
jgi:uncharacterized protein YkvS